MNCPNCGGPVQDNAVFCNNCGMKITRPAPASAPNPAQGMNFEFNTNTATPNTAKPYQYQVLSQKDKWFTGKFDPLVLEQALNAYAQQGWRVIACATADIPGFGSARQEFITVLEREC